MALPRPFGRGPFGAGPYARGAAGVIEVGGVAVLSFDAHGAAALAWARLPVACGTGLWTPQDCTAGAWAPVDSCGTGAWTVTRLPELEPA